MSDEADNLNISGTAQFQGEVDLTLNNPQLARPGDHSVSITSAQGGVVDQGVFLAAPQSAVASYGLDFGARQVLLNYGIDFSPDTGLNANQTAIGDYINDIQLAGSSVALADLTSTLLVLPQVAQVAGVYDQLSPEPYLASVSSSFFSAQRFSQSLRSCGQNQGQGVAVRNGNDCTWMQASTQTLTHQENFETFSYRERAQVLSGGANRQLSNGWSVRLAGSWNGQSGRSGAAATYQGHRGQAGVALEHQNGGQRLSLALHGGMATSSVTRSLSIAGVADGRAQGDASLGFVSADVEVSQHFETGNGYVRPSIGIGMTYIAMSDIAERGVGALNLNVKGSGNVLMTGRAGIEMGTTIDLGDDVRLTPFADLGLVGVADGSGLQTRSGLAGAPAVAGTFATSTDLGGLYADLEAGLEVDNGQGAKFGVIGSAKLSNATQDYAIGLNLSVEF